MGHNPSPGNGAAVSTSLTGISSLTVERETQNNAILIEFNDIGAKLYRKKWKLEIHTMSRSLSRNDKANSFSWFRWP